MIFTCGEICSVDGLNPYLPPYFVCVSCKVSVRLHRCAGSSKTDIYIRIAAKKSNFTTKEQFYYCYC